jgi:tetratricopeptide (TPR) repeat protein
MLAQYYVEQEMYQQAYDEIKKATVLAPRNIERNKKSWDLARLMHDHKGQFLATRNIAHHAKNSIHDSPELLLNVIRSGIDLACATPDESSNAVLKQTDRYIEQLENDYEDAHLFKQQLIIAKARLYSARNEETKAIKLIENHASLTPSSVLEDNLDKVKALHELGMREDAERLLSAIKKQISGDSLASQVVSRYIEQETQEREEIHFTAKQLNSMAVEHFQKKRLQPALDAIAQALQLSPNNVKLMISQLKILITIKQQDEDQAEHLVLAEQAIAYLTQITLEGRTATVAQELQDKWRALHK